MRILIEFFFFESVDEVVYLEEEEVDIVDIDESGTNQWKRLRCDICDRAFSSVAERNNHIEDHFKSIECPNCKRSFIGDRAYSFHVTSGKCKENVDLDRFKCCLCNEKVFDSLDMLNDHLLTEHNCIITEDQISCELCNRTFGKLKYLRKHVRELHDNATPFDCGTCGKKFKRKANLLEHELIHQGKYLAKCKTCGLSYRTKSALKLHERTHTGEKPYKCDICNQKSYAYNTDLKRHKRSIHGIFNGTTYPCTLCSKVYYEPKLLKNHMNKSHKDS